MTEGRYTTTPGHDIMTSGHSAMRVEHFCYAGTFLVLWQEFTVLFMTQIWRAVLRITVELIRKHWRVEGKTNGEVTLYTSIAVLMLSVCPPVCLTVGLCRSQETSKSLDTFGYIMI